VYCSTANDLLELNMAASTNYHQAITVLAKLAGLNDVSAFTDAKDVCETRLTECTRTRSEFWKHKADHGC